jgi:dTDP-4-amino-4,6-dideoxygalactose transaminase
MSVAPAVERVPFSPPDIGPDEIAEVVATLTSGWLSTGPRVRRFEEAFAAYVGAPHAIALNSCTAGLHLALVEAGAEPGTEVITTPLTFCSTANVIVHAGATPVFADVDPATGNLDPGAAASAVTPRTLALMPVHYGGRPADVRALSAIAARHGLATIEDAAHAIEAVSNAGKVGTTAAFTCFSFYATKNLTTGEGGMVTTASAAAAARLRALSLHGMTSDAWARYERPGLVHYDVLQPGFKYNMPDLQAAIGLHQLRAIDRHLLRRRAICSQYDEAFADLPIRRFGPVPPGTVHAHHLYTVLIDRDSGTTRDEVASALAARGIASSLHFPPVHRHRYYAERFGFRRGQFPHAERIADTVLSLPLSPALTDGQVGRVIAALREVLRAA